MVCKNATAGNVPYGNKLIHLGMLNENLDLLNSN